LFTHLGLHRKQLLEIYKPHASQYYCGFIDGRSKPEDTYDKMEFLTAYDGWAVYIHQDDPDFYLLGKPVIPQVIYIEGIKCIAIAKAEKNAGIFVQCMLKYQDNKVDAKHHNDLYFEKMKNPKGPGESIPYPVIRKYYNKKQLDALSSNKGVIAICKEILPYILVKEECFHESGL